MKKAINKYMALLCIAILTAVIPLASADNVEPSSITVADTNSNGIMDINDTKTITFWATGPWTVTGVNSHTPLTVVILASGTVSDPPHAEQVTVQKTDRQILEATWDDPEMWVGNQDRVINITIWSHELADGKTIIIETAHYQWNIAKSKWEQTTSFTTTSSGKAEIPEFPTLALPVVAVIGLVFLLNNRRKTQK